MSRALVLSLVVNLGAMLSGCGSMTRDVIVEKNEPDSAVLIITPEDGGVWPVTEEDAAAPSGANTSGECTRDGGCSETRRCPVNECSQLCTLGCENHRPRKRTMSRGGSS